MARKQKLAVKKFDSAVESLRTLSFDVVAVPGVANQVRVAKYGAAAVLARLPDGGIGLVAGPGCLIAGRIALLVDRGYQKFFTAEKAPVVAATAERLRALHDFQEELGAEIGQPDNYNLSLGTVSDLYLYDRVKGREAEPESAAADSH